MLIMRIVVSTSNSVSTTTSIVLNKPSLIFLLLFCTDDVPDKMELNFLLSLRQVNELLGNFSRKLKSNKTDRFSFVK